MTALLQEYVTRQAQARADALAVVTEDGAITYGVLDAASNQLARLLTSQGCEPGDRVCLLQPKTGAAIVSMLGVLKAGCVYVPVDITGPAPRVEKIVRAADPRVLLTAAPAVALVDDLAEALDPAVMIGSVEEHPLEGHRFRSVFARPDWEALPTQAVAAVRSAPAAAHLLFTSGSTGTPKGVVITHANVVAFVEWATAYFRMGPDDRVSGHPPLHFDLSTFDIYGSFAVGAQLHLVPAELNLVPQRLAAFIRSRELTQWFSVPSILAYLAKFGAVDHGDFPSLRRLLWCGEVLPTPVLIHWMQRLPHVSFTNLYGPTEATIASSYYRVPTCPEDETEAIPIGTPCDGEELLVLDETLRPVPAGETADLYIAGAGLSPGYWRDEDKTRSAFIPDPRRPDSTERIYRTGDLARVTTDGLVQFLGRADSQIKSRGYRIELGEVEAALNAVEGLRECAVVGVPTEGFEGTAIACAFSPATAEVDASTLRQALVGVLPAYMLPSRWIALDPLPKNANGKIDRRRVREMFERDVRP